MRSTTLVLVFVALSATYANAFYLPGVAPKEFKPDDTVVLKYDKMDSTKTQLPYSIYDLPFCTPKDADKKDKDGNPDVVVVNAADNLGEVLAGDRMETSRMNYASSKIMTAKYCARKNTPKAVGQDEKVYR